MNPSTIYSKSGKGVQEAAGKTSLLKRGDRAVLSAIDGRATLAEVAQKVGKAFDAAFEQLITQLDKDGFVREVTAGASSTGSRPAAPKPAAPAAKAPPPAAPSGGRGGEDLDFTSIMPALKPGPAPSPKPSDKAAEQRAKEQESALYKARHEAEARAQAERDRARSEMEAKARAEAEAKIRAETEKKVREEAEAKLKAEADAKAKAKAGRDAAVRMAAEAKAKAEADAKAKIDAERKAREEVERKARQEEERKAREAEERKRKEEEERRRKEEEERRAREEAERKRKEEEEARKRQEEEERRAREKADRAAREQEEARRREEEDRRIREKEEQARAAERKREEDERKREEDERRREEEERARKSMEETATRQPTLAAVPPPAAKEGGPGSLDALMADLDSFSQREEQERSSRESAEHKAREEKKRRAQEESERRAKEEAELERREAEGRRRKEEEQRRAQEEAERRVREAEEQRRIEAEERNRKARESLAAKEAQPSRVPAATDDIGVTDHDLDMDEVRQDEAVVAKESRKEQRERERETRQREREARERAQAAAREEPVKYSRPRRPVKWGKPLAMTLFVLLLVGVGALHVVPLPMSDYEDAASEALGRPVRIASGRLSLFTGVSLNLDGVTIGDSVKIATVRAYPRFGSLIGENKAFRRMELEGVSIAQQALGETLFAKVQGERFSVGRILVTKLNLAGPLPLPPLEADAVLGPDGALRTVTLRGPENLNVKLTPANANVEFDGTASSFTLPFAPEVSLTSFAMNGTATRQGMNIAAWGGSILDGALSGTARVRWGGTWQVDGVVTVRGINAAVFAPALLSEGKAEGTGKFSMSGADPARLAAGTRIEGNFSLGKGALGFVDIGRTIQTSGRQSAGRTPFLEMSGQGAYDRGAVAIRNVVISAGALNVGASADIAQSGALNGRIVADVKTAGQSLRQTINVGGTVREPQVRN